LDLPDEELKAIPPEVARELLEYAYNVQGK